MLSSHSAGKVFLSGWGEMRRSADVGAVAEKGLSPVREEREEEWLLRMRGEREDNRFYEI